MSSNPANAYREFRAAKLDNYPLSVAELCVDIDGLDNLGDESRMRILDRCSRANMAIYNCHDKAATKSSVRKFAASIGLTRFDNHLCSDDNGVSEVSVASTGDRAEYVPYSNRSLSWHTDGYYNDSSKRVRAVILHCCNDAAEGGENAILDQEMAYIRLRDADPAYIAALEHPECMTIPANNGADGEIRPAICGPVFWYDDADGSLQMRYSARKTNILWRDDPATAEARHCLAELLADKDGPVLHCRLQPGQGLISNNVLHNRTAFEDRPGQKRLLYRARFFDRIHTS